MGILSRFTDIVKSNINDLLDKAEDPAKLVDQYLRDLTESLAEVKKETAGVIAEESRAKRLLEENKEDIKKYESLARKALSAGNEGDARTFLAKKQRLEEKAEGLQATYNTAHENANKMRQMHDKLVNDIETLRSRREMIKAKVSVARTQKKVNQFTGAEKASGAMSAFDRMEERANSMLDQANAMAELNEAPTDEALELERKYSGANASSVEDELQKLKQEMGI